MAEERRREYLAVDGNGAVVDGMQSQDGGLGRVDDGRAHERAEDAFALVTIEEIVVRGEKSIEEIMGAEWVGRIRTAIGDGEGAASHVLDADAAVARLSAQLSKLALDVEEGHALGVADDGHNEPLHLGWQRREGREGT